ncbi:hypothetical protein VE25_07310 [Devosia geojensis]|uniref:Uncharacterized protein n=1 Tax=Devosia geojensis TaxID=443610 RepID=A0A0F5FU06_9HYPH|nr:hypothetical protein [Devosia geojensis]KKB12359.1 hypothetical protein VE25_07310 [Devosia geojensis]
MGTIVIDPARIVTAAEKAARAAAEARRAEFPDLEPDQFWFVLRVSGHDQDVLGWVASLNDPASPNYDPVLWAYASSKFERAKYFERDHPLVLSAAQAIGIPDLQLDDLWRYGATGGQPAQA